MSTKKMLNDELKTKKTGVRTPFNVSIYAQALKASGYNVSLQDALVFYALAQKVLEKGDSITLNDITQIIEDSKKPF